MASTQSAQPVNPALAQEAQIPLKDFTIPSFPPEASNLKALTLTSDIKPSEYHTLLSDFATIPALPQSIESLTLELFSLGYPPGFLASLASQLPNLKTFVTYAQILCGTTDASTDDAISFFEKSKHLRALHLLDVFARPGFWERVAGELAKKEKDLLFLEVSYTFRHEDEDFLSRLAPLELPKLVRPGLVSCSLNVSASSEAPLETQEEESGEVKDGVKKEGIMAFNKSLSSFLVEALVEPKTAPTELKMLNVTLYTLTLEQLKTVLKTHTGILALFVTVEVEPEEKCKSEILEALAYCQELEQVEIVGNPSLSFFMEASNPKRNTLEKTFPSRDDLTKLAEKCTKLSSFKADVLRTTTMGALEWTKENGEWKGGVKTANAEKS